MWFTQLGGTNDGEALAPAVAKGASAVLYPPGTTRPAWRSIPWKLLACVLLCVSPWSPVSAQIRAIQEDGRTVFVNDGTVASRPASRRRGRQYGPLEYWSNTEQRWKPLPPASSSLLRRARDAAAEVQSFAKAVPERNLDRDSVATIRTRSTSGEPSFQLCRDRQHYRRSCGAASCRSEPGSGGHQSRVKLQSCGGFAQGSHGIDAVDACHGA